MSTREWLSTLDPRLQKQLEFLIEIDKLKTILRASHISDNTRQENSAEHSWHICMFALVLAEHANENIEVSRVITMLLLHDIVEIDAGDAPLHGTQDPKHAAKEQAAAQRLFQLLPDDQADKMRGLWEEFEAGASADARFAHSVDRLQPVMLNTLTDGGTWPTYNVTPTTVRERTKTIQRGSSILWNAANKIYEYAEGRGWLGHNRT